MLINPNGSSMDLQNPGCQIIFSNRWRWYNHIVVFACIANVQQLITADNLDDVPTARERKLLKKNCGVYCYLI